MNTGQMLLSLCAVVLLSFLILRVDSSQLTTQEQLINSKIGIMAISIGSSIIEDANKKAFDEKTVNGSVGNANDLSSTLGTDIGEYSNDPNTFDDFDDYNGMNQPYYSLDSTKFNIRCSVYYIDPKNPGTKSTIQTFSKEMDLTISSPFMQDTIKLNTIFSYWTQI